MRTRHVAVQSSGPFRPDMPFDKAVYEPLFADLGRELGKRGGILHITKEQKNYLGGMRFARSWVFRDGQFEVSDDAFEAHVILNKDSAFTPDDGAFVINKKELDTLCNDKPMSSDLFPTLFPKTFTVDSAEELKAALVAIPGDRAVLKPVDGYGGKGVWIGKKENAPMDMAYPLMAQEFIDTSDGFAPITTTNHDLRLTVINGEVINSFIRTPGKKKLVSNPGHGGWVTPVYARDRPKGALDLVPVIDREFKKFGPRMYAIDCARNTDGRWLLIELNSPPGQHGWDECGDEAAFYFDRVCSLLLSEPPSPRKEDVL